MSEKKELQAINLIGKITATSNKQGKYKESPRKSVYLQLDEENSIKAIEFGLTEYTSKQGDKYFIVKASENIKVNIKGDDSLDNNLASSVNDPNFKLDKNLCMLSLLKGESDKNTYIRFYSMLVASMDDIEIIEAKDPYEDVNMDDLPF